ncbi:MAG: polysaccharide deacetylase family protein [Treponema sp.]|nr:polysaccharide deacetylase family protein [Treponema sp.]MCL2250816.1 polysaccharide deacetylase family protein [Treponema sp.]
MRLNRFFILTSILLIVLGGCATKTNSAFPKIDKWIAITFNDGPSANTETYLNIMKDNDIKATFFVSGFNFDRDIYENIVKRMIDEGHEIANNLYTNVNLADETSRQPIRDNIKKAQDSIKEKTGSEPKYFRPPMLNKNNYVDDVVKELGLIYIGGYNTDDWDYDAGPSILKEKVLKNVKNGQIIILHDFGNNNTFEAFPDLVYELRKQGYGFVTVSELASLRNANLVPGRWYDNF